MRRELPRYVYRKGRKGYLYFTQGTTQRIHSPFPSDAFWAEYALLLRGDKPKPPRTSFDALIVDYKRSQRWRKLAPRTQQDYGKVLDFLREKIGAADVTKFKRKHAIRIRDTNSDAVRFANYCVQVLRVLFEHAHDIGWVEDNPVKGVSLLKSDRQGRQPWPQELIEAFRREADDDARLIFELCLGTGQRIGDVLSMRWADVDRDGIHVHQRKTGEKLLVPFTRHLSAVLAKTGVHGITIVVGAGGRRLSYRAASDRVMRVRKKIGAEAYDIHSLRYTAAHELAAAGCSDELIMAVTGHRTGAMVRQYAGAARQVARAREAQEKRR